MGHESKATFLLLDDNPDDRALIRRQILKDFSGISFLEPTDKKSFEKMVETQNFDLVITDFQLQWTNGLTTLKTVKTRYPDCPVLMFTGTGSEEIAVEAMKAGLDDYILKSPKHFIRLSASVGALLKKAHQAKRLRESEGALAIARQEWATIFQAIPHPTLILDRNFTIMAANRANEALTGLSEAEIVGQHCFTIYHQTDAPPEGCLLEHYLRGGNNEVMEQEMMAVGNRTMLVGVTSVKNKQGIPTKYIHIAADITPLKEAQGRLRETTERLKTLINTLPDFVIYKDGEGRWQDVNDKTLEIFNLQGVDYRGKGDQELSGLVHPCYKEALKTCDRTNEMAWAKGRLSRVDEIIPTPDGEERVFDVIKVPEFYPDKKRKGLLVVGRNITELRLAEEEKGLLQGQLYHAQKLEAIGTLAGGVAHDFNNALATMRGFAELAMLKTNEKAPIYPYLKQIDDATHRAAALVNQLLLFSRQQPLEFSSFSPVETIQSLIKMLTRLIGKNISIDSAFYENTWPVYGDKTSFEQVITNLVINARDAMPRGGSLSIKTENIALEEDACRANPDAYPGRFVCLTVSDTGEGMDEELQAHIYEPFFTTREVGKGTGLGLPVVYGIVTRHHGWITIESAPGRGTTFHLYFPAATQAQIDAPPPKQVAFKAFKGHGETILVVEDDEMLRDFLISLFDSHAYHVKAVCNAAKALKTAKATDFHPDLVFTDVMLPDGDGFQLAKDLRDMAPDVKLLLTSGYPEPRTQWQDFEKYGMQFIQKPYSVAHLLSVVQAILTTG